MLRTVPLPKPSKKVPGEAPVAVATTSSVSGVMFATKVPVVPVPATIEWKTLPSVPTTLSAQGKLAPVSVSVYLPSAAVVAVPVPAAHLMLTVAPGSAAPLAAVPAIVTDDGVAGGPHPPPPHPANAKRQRKKRNRRSPANRVLIGGLCHRPVALVGVNSPQIAVRDRTDGPRCRCASMETASLVLARSLCGSANVWPSPKQMTPNEQTRKSSRSVSDPAALVSHIYDAALDSSTLALVHGASRLVAERGHRHALVARLRNRSIQFRHRRRQPVDRHRPRLDDPGRVSATTARATSGFPTRYQLAEGSITVSSALYPDALLKRTEWYDGFLRKCDLFYAVGSSIVKEEKRDVKMSFVRSERAGRYYEAELHLVRQLMPHLRNAVLVHWQSLSIEGAGGVRPGGAGQGADGDRPADELRPADACQSTRARARQHDDGAALRIVRDPAGLVPRRPPDRCSG